MQNRKSDITFIICQNNDQKVVTIESIHEPVTLLKDVIGYSSAEVKGKSLKTFLPEDIIQAIDESLEFNDFGTDISAIFKKINDFRLMSKKGEVVHVNLRIHRTASPDKNSRFIMVLRDRNRVASGLVQVLEDLRAHEILDEKTGLCTWESFMKKVDIVHSYLGKDGTTASFALIGIDKFKEFTGIYGKEAGNKLIREVASVCRRTFREADVLGMVGAGRFGVVLLEAGQDVAKIPLNRLRGHMVNQPLFISEKSSTTITISIAYQEVAKGKKIENTIEICKEILNKNLDKNNQILDS